MTLRLVVPPSLGRAKASARAELMEQSLTQQLGVSVTVEVAESYHALEVAALSGAAHLVWCPAAICARVEPSAHAVLTIVRSGRWTYRSAIVARTDARISLARFSGLRAAWVDRLSLGGHLLAVAHLRARGIEPARAFVSQRFEGSHPAVLSAILHGSADVGAVSIAADDDESLKAGLSMLGGPAASALSVIGISAEAPNDALVLTAKLDEPRARSIMDKLFDARKLRASSLLLSSMDAQGFVRAAPGTYAAITSLLTGDNRG